MIAAIHIDTLLQEAPGQAVVNALQILLDVDRHLMEVDANERSITFRFAMHLQAEFPGWYVDCEYNRDGVEPKRIGHLGLYPEIEDAEAKTVFPDVIVHQRGPRPGKNYLVVEFKKSTSTVDRDIDRQKLHGYKRDLAYQHALFIEIGIVQDPGLDPYIEAVEWIR